MLDRPRADILFFPPAALIVVRLPRTDHIDAPGVLHHIICSGGIERRQIVLNDANRNDFS